MDIAAAFQIVLDLAKQNALTDRDNIAGEMTEVIADQQEALKLVEDFIVNQLGDD